MGSDSLKIGDRTNFGWVIHSSERFNMVSDWSDYVFLYPRRDGSFSVKGYKFGENFKTPRRLVWIPIDSVLRVRRAEELLAAVERVQASLDVYVESSDLMQVMSALNSRMAASLRVLLDD